MSWKHDLETLVLLAIILSPSCYMIWLSLTDSTGTKRPDDRLEGGDQDASNKEKV